MFFRTLCLLTIMGYLQVQCYVPVPLLYRKVEAAIRRYSSNMSHNPVIHSLLNALVYDKQAKAFITDEAIETSLKDVKKINEKDEPILREFIYGTKTSLQSTTLTADLKEDVESALDTFFSHPNVDDNQTFDLLSSKKKP